MNFLKLFGYNITEAVVTWPHAFPGDVFYETEEPLVHGGFYTKLLIQPAARFMSVPRDYSVTIKATIADTGYVLWERTVTSNLEVTCFTPAGSKIRYQISFPKSEQRRPITSPLKLVWNPRVTLFVASGTSGRVAKDTVYR